MNTTQVVRAEASVTGIKARIWIDDVEGRHLAVAELDIPKQWLLDWVLAVQAEEHRTEQHQLEFDK